VVRRSTSAAYDNPEHKTHGGAAIWAYRRNDVTGRVVNIGSHPKGAKSGDRLTLTEACVLYTLAGTGRPRIKARLEPGKVRRMDQPTSADQPDFCRIGDRQFHHFKFEATKSKPIIRIELASNANVPLNLYLKKDAPAFRANAEYGRISPESTKTIEKELSPGIWYVSVECAASVEAFNDPDSDSGFYRYVSGTELLNGVPYRMTLCESESMSSAP